MKTSRLALCIIGVSTLLAAEPICRRIIFPAVHKHHSTATIARWTEWNKTHVPPTPKAILAELDLICPEILTQNVEQTGFILPTETPQWVPTEVAVPVSVDNLIADGVVQPLPNFELSAVNSNAPNQVPESSTLALFGLGLFAYCALFSRTNKIKSN